MKAQLELARIQTHASQQTECDPLTGGTRQAREGENSKFKMPKLPVFVDRRDYPDSRLLRFERFAPISGWPKESWCMSLSGRALEAFCRLSRMILQIMIVSRKFYQRDIT